MKPPGLLTPNQALLDRLLAGESIAGCLLFLSDGRVVAAEDARVADWEDLEAQHEQSAA